MNSIANTILEQLGGNRFLAMTGARCMDFGNGLQIKLPKISKLSCVSVTYSYANDCYDVRGYTGRGVGMKLTGAELFDVQASELRATFTRLTGLDCTL